MNTPPPPSPPILPLLLGPGEQALPDSITKSEICRSLYALFLQMLLLQNGPQDFPNTCLNQKQEHIMSFSLVRWHEPTLDPFPLNTSHAPSILPSKWT